MNEPLKYKLAAQEDIPVLLAKTLKFGDIAYPDIVKNKTHIALYIKEAIELRLAFIAIDKKSENIIGFICFIVSPCHFNLDIMMATEVTFWFNNESKNINKVIRFLKFAEIILFTRDIKIIILVRLDLLADTGKLYERLGYSKRETCFCKVLK